MNVSRASQIYLFKTKFLISFFTSVCSWLNLLHPGEGHLHPAFWYRRNQGVVPSFHYLCSIQSVSYNIENLSASLLSLFFFFLATLIEPLSPFTQIVTVTTQFVFRIVLLDFLEIHSVNISFLNCSSFRRKCNILAAHKALYVLTPSYLSQPLPSLLFNDVYQFLTVTKLSPELMPLCHSLHLEYCFSTLTYPSMLSLSDAGSERPFLVLSHLN